MCRHLEFTPFFYQLGDAPVDIYFLFDSSNSMQDLKDEMQEKARKIIKAVRGLTTDAQFGIGGYTDKPIVPFANEPKEGGEKAHQKVFAFQHHLTITDDSNALTKAIGNVHFLPLDDVGGGRNNAFYYVGLILMYKTPSRVDFKRI